MSWGMVAVAGGSLISGVLGSKSQKKQAQLQADAITEAGQIDSAARNKAIGQVLEIFGPSLVEFNNSMQSSIDLMSQGRMSTGDLLTQSANNVSQIVQQGGQSALNAMLGLPAPEFNQPVQPQPQTGKVPPATDYQRDLDAGKYSGQPRLASKESPAWNQPVGGLTNSDGLVVNPDGTIKNNNGYVNGRLVDQQAGQPVNTSIRDNYNPNMSMATGDDYRPSAGIGNQGPINLPDEVIQRNNERFANYNMGPNQAQTTFTPQTPLEGELIPRDYQFSQQGLTMPAGTNAGLMGAEAAVQGGADAGRFNLAQGATGALQSLNQGTELARTDIGQGRDFALGQMRQGLDAGRQGIRSGVNAINQGVQAGVGSINQGVSQATGYLQPYMSAGQEALNPLLDLSGVRGQEAFDAARMNDPAYNLAIQESERALGRNAAVTGGLGSGNTKGRFQLNAQQQAAADIDRQLGRFRAITDAGQAAAGTAGSFATQGGIAAGNLQGQGGMASGNLLAQGGQMEAQQLNAMANVGINSSQQLAQLAQQLGMSEAQVLNQLGGNLANIDVGTGNAIGGMREQAGINAANLIQGTTNAQAGIDAGLAQQLANLDQTTLNNISNAMQAGAGTNLSTNQQLATILANMGIGAGTSSANSAIALGQANAAGVTNPIGNAINTGIGLYASGAFGGMPSPYQPTSGNPTAAQTIASYNAGTGY